MLVCDEVSGDQLVARVAFICDESRNAMSAGSFENAPIKPVKSHVAKQTASSSESFIQVALSETELSPEGIAAYRRATSQQLAKPKIAPVPLPSR